ncbi:hypothetical protein FPV67DRAFT_1450869 [Lyophyllum atratum]|nr:hypothetical protein FPV67DRAFT_1450869 [Lyophyllum atratum]
MDVTMAYTKADKDLSVARAYDKAEDFPTVEFLIEWDAERSSQEPLQSDGSPVCFDDENREEWEAHMRLLVTSLIDVGEDYGDDYWRIWTAFRYYCCGLFTWMYDPELFDYDHETPEPHGGLEAALITRFGGDLSASPLTVECSRILHLMCWAPIWESVQIGRLGRSMQVLCRSWKIGNVQLPSTSVRAQRAYREAARCVKALVDTFCSVGRARAAAEVRVATHCYAAALAKAELFAVRASDEALCSELVRVLDHDMNHDSHLPADCLTKLTQVLYEPYLGLRSTGQAIFERGEYLRQMLKEMEDGDGVADAMGDDDLVYDDAL